MSYPKRVLRLNPSRGILADVPPYAVDREFYTTGQNVIFRIGLPNRVKGFRDAYVTALGTINPVEIFHLLNTSVGGLNRWLLVEADGSVWAIAGDVATQIDGTLISVISDPSLYSSTLLNGIPVISNAIDEPFFWSGSGNVQTLTDWIATETAKFIVAFQFHLFAMDIDGPSGVFPNLVKWSDATEPGTIPDTWTPGAGNTAGSVELSDGKGPVLCAVPLKDTLIFYKQSMSYGAQFVSGNQIFAFRPLNRKAGALNRHSVVDIGERHLIVEQGDIVISDGINRRSIGESRHKDFLFNQLDQDNFQKLACSFYQPTDEVLISFSTVGADFSNLALVYNVARDSFGIRDLPDVRHIAVGFVTDTIESLVWDSDAGAWDDDNTIWNSSTIAATTESLVFAKITDIELQNTSDEVIVSAFIGKHDIDFDDPERIKFVKRVHIQAEPGYGQFFVRVGARFSTTDSILWSPEVTLNEPEQIVNIITQGRYISVEIRSANEKAWIINAIDLEAELRGYH